MTGLLPLPGAEFAAAAAVLFVGAYLNGALGFGMGMLAAPILVLINPALVPVPVLILGGLVTAAGVWRDRAALDLGEVGWALTGRVPGTIAGAAVVAIAAPAVMGVLVGTCVLIGVAIAAMDRMPARTATSMSAAGFSSGLMATIAAVGGPPMVLIYQDAPAAVRRAALSLFFFVGTFMSLAALYLADSAGTEQLVLSACLVPAAAAGYLAGAFGPEIRREAAVRGVLLVICFAAGAAVLIRNLVILAT